MKVLVVDQILSVNCKYTFGLVNNVTYKNIHISVIGDEKEDTHECVVKCHSLFNTANKEKNKIQKVLNYLKSWKEVYSMCKNEGIDVIHVQWFILSPVDYYFINKIKKFGVKVVVTVHDILPFNEKFYDYRYHNKIYDLADSIIVQAEINKKRINELFSNIDNKVKCIPHGNFVEYSEPCDKEVARKYLNVPMEKKVLLFFGQIKKVKGLHVLIEAFNQLVKERDDLILIIAGKVWGDDFNIYEQLINKYGLQDKVMCHIKYIADDEIKYYYSAADINVLPYLNVYQSGVVQLAYAYEKAVVATNVGAFPEVVIDGETGLLVEPNNHVQLANAIGRLLKDEDSINSMGINGKRFVTEELSWEKISSKITEVYKSI